MPAAAWRPLCLRELAFSSADSDKRPTLRQMPKLQEHIKTNGTSQIFLRDASVRCWACRERCRGVDRNEHCCELAPKTFGKRTFPGLVVSKIERRCAQDVRFCGESQRMDEQWKIEPLLLCGVGAPRP